MEEAYGDEGGTSTDAVVATTGLGLLKILPAGQNTDIRYEVVLQPKVVLESSLKAALEPAPPRKRSKGTKRT